MANLFQSVFIGSVLTVIVVIIIVSVIQPQPLRVESSNTELRKENVFAGSGIPRFVHYTYMHELLPLEYRELIRSCLKLNPDVIFVFWTDQDAYDLVKKHFPDRFEVYKSYIKGEREKLKKSDLIRPLVLHRYGGVYMDLDTRCQKPLAPVLNKDSCIISTDVDVKTEILYNIDVNLMNSFMACIRQHHFMGFIIDSMTKNKQINILTETGPILLTDLYEFYRRGFLSSSEVSNDHRYHITVGSWRTFSPYIDRDLNSYCVTYRKTVKNPETPREQGCHLLKRYLTHQSVDIANATVVHLFLHLGYSNVATNIRKTFNITSDFPDIVQGSMLH